MALAHLQLWPCFSILLLNLEIGNLSCQKQLRLSSVGGPNTAYGLLLRILENDLRSYALSQGLQQLSAVNNLFAKKNIHSLYIVVVLKEL